MGRLRTHAILRVTWWSVVLGSLPDRDGIAIRADPSFSVTVAGDRGGRGRTRLWSK